MARSLGIAVGLMAVASAAVFSWKQKWFTPNPTDPGATDQPRSESSKARPAPFIRKGHAGGYVLFSPMLGRRTFLVNRRGEVVHSWESAYKAGRTAYLLPDGSLLRAGRAKPYPKFQKLGGLGGRLQRIEPDGTVTWDAFFGSETYAAHHDIEPLPNGNVLLLAYEHLSRQEATELGRNPEDGTNDVFIDTIVEIAPSGKGRADVIWRWSPLNHLVQDFDDSLPTYGEISNHPDRIDFNYVTRNDGDWLHFNSIDYHPERDQILVSSHAFSELWIIDHSTTEEEARADRGGRTGKGGRLLYRWGNPLAWKAGTESDRQLFRQHDARWIPEGYPGAGNITCFNNGWTRPEIEYSTVLELIVPTTSRNGYRNDSPTLFPGRIRSG
ncbi:MAG: aryl-sulfate sulfotransferase [Cyanobacteria bacterium P01_A01_bin.17]